MEEKKTRNVRINPIKAGSLWHPDAGSVSTQVLPRRVLRCEKEEAISGRFSPLRLHAPSTSSIARSFPSSGEHVRDDRSNRKPSTNFGQLAGANGFRIRFVSMDYIVAYT